VHSSLQLVPADARSVGQAARRRDNCLPYQRPSVRELSLRLEPVEVDDFGGLLASPSAARGKSINPQRGAHS
jgi:hypothetical protein